YGKLQATTERVALTTASVAHCAAKNVPVMHRLKHGRQYSIGGRTVVEDRQISEGGFAFVWLAHDVVSHEELVLKKILCQDKAALTMAQREVDLLERLPQHPNLVRYYGHTILGTEGKKTKEAILLFEICPGGHLLDLLDRAQGVLGEDRILAVFAEVVAGVAVLHAMRPAIQHRDLKVENVLLGADGKFKLLDFGSWSDECSDTASLDKHAISALQEHIERYTTMMYRPPEMVDFFNQFVISEKVDIWMLGCILFTLMFYRHPFQDESALAIANARYNFPSTPEYSQKLQDLSHWLLARDPGDRPTSRELLQILHGFKECDRPLTLPKAVVERWEQSSP
ncbi:unnamed protein product, partial [Polarella glacialis]